MAICSRAKGVPTPDCRGRKLDSCSLASGVESNVFPTKRLRVSPIAMGLTLDPFGPLRRGMSEEAHKQGAASGGRDPDEQRLVNCKREERRAEVAGLKRLLVRSCKCAGRRPDGPGADPGGKWEIAC